MNTKKLWWHVAVCYVDDTVDIVRTHDYEKAVLLAESTWRQECDEYSKTQEAGVSDVVLFDGRGRVLWSANDEPRGLFTTGYFEHLQAHQQGRPMASDLASISVTAIR
jgi:hypothetical protein